MQYPLDDFRRTAHQLKSPIYMLGLGVALLRQYFGTEDRIAIEKSKFVWTQDEGTSQVYINNSDNFDYVTTGKRPAILVELGEINYPVGSLGDSMAYNEVDGRFAILDRAEGSWSFVCLGDKPLEALSLATEVKYFFQTYRRPIADAFALDKIRTSGISKWQKQKEYKDNWGSIVTVSFAFQDNFDVGIESLKVSAFQLGLVPV